MASGPGKLDASESEKKKRVVTRGPKAGERGPALRLSRECGQSWRRSCDGLIDLRSLRAGIFQTRIRAVPSDLLEGDAKIAQIFSNVDVTLAGGASSILVVPCARASPDVEMGMPGGFDGHVVG